jgi:hypothetical protein
MNHTFIDFHKNRYEWAFHAEREFINRFVRLDVQKAERSLTKEFTLLGTSDVNELSFNHLTKLYSEAKEESKLEFEEHKKNIEKLEQLIERKRLQIIQELNALDRKEKQISSEIENYKAFSMELEKIMNDIKAIEIESFVKSIIIYDTSHKKASVLNGYASNLKLTVETDLEKQLMKIEEEVHNLNITSGRDLRLPKLASIPKIYQKIDAFWLTSSYDKAFYHLCDKAIDWVVAMYNAYLDVLTPILNGVEEQREQLVKKAQALKWMKDEKVIKQQKEIAQDEKRRDQLMAQHDEVYKMWQQDCEHAKQLQGYFIKHWLLYKEELQQHFLSSSVKERWFISQYLQLLQQDGEKIIESLNI